MNIRWIKAEWDQVECDALVIPFFQGEPLDQGVPAELDQKLAGLVRELKETEEYEGKSGQFATFYRPAGIRAGRIVLAGADKKEEFNAAAIRNFALQVLRRHKSYNFRKIAFYRRSVIDATVAAQAAVEGVILATYEGDDYKTQDKAQTVVQELLLVSREEINTKKVEDAIRRGEILAQATNLARQLANEPGNRLNPPLLAEKAREIAEKSGLSIEVLGEREMSEKGMNGVLAVARGSDEPAQFIILKHLGDPHSDGRPLVLIGKGVTFDSGGLSLKPAQSMEEMKSDKAGACAVLGAMQAISQLQVKKNVVALMPVVENLPSGRAQRPGDVIRSMSGKTIEVVNTDAEGRLILADALYYAQQFNPVCMVDIATLTGACVVALGHIRAGLFCNHEHLAQGVLEAAERSGEKLWRLPLDEEYRREIRSEIADIKNVGSRWGGAITAAKFLQEFVADIPWCHIDMAGVDLFREGQEGKGPTGFGVRTLAELAYSIRIGSLTGAGPVAKKSR